MLVSNTSKRLHELMELKGLSQSDILRKCEPYCDKYNVKLSRGHISQYVSGKVVPKQDKLTILGVALNVNEAWLMGYDVPMERQQNLIENLKSNIDNNIDRFKKEFSNEFISEEEMTEIINFAKYIISKRGVE